MELGVIVREWATQAPNYFVGTVSPASFSSEHDWVVQLMYLSAPLTRWGLRHYGSDPVYAYAQTAEEAMAAAEAMQSEITAPPWESKLAGALVDQLLS